MTMITMASSNICVEDHIRVKPKLQIPGIPDVLDTDDDNDGIPDSMDKDALAKHNDLDGDGMWEHVMVRLTPASLMVLTKIFVFM